MFKHIFLVTALLLAARANAFFFRRSPRHFPFETDLTPRFSSLRPFPTSPPSPQLTPLYFFTEHQSCRCPRRYRSTCCLTRFGPRTAPSRCACRCRGLPLHLGACNNCRCPRIYRPVCCSIGRRRFTAPNVCACGCVYGFPVRRGSCPREQAEPVEPAPVTEPATQTPPVTQPATQPPPVTQPATPPIPFTQPATPPTPVTQPATQPVPHTEPVPAPAPAPTTTCPCQKIYAPVCCARGGVAGKEPNACECACNGGIVMAKGGCAVPGVPTTPAPAPVATLPLRCICPLVFAPVCCARAGTMKTESNACFCDCDGGIIKGEGECDNPEVPALSTPTPMPTAAPIPSCRCPRIYAPVCCRKHGNHVTEPNGCECKCHGGDVMAAGACENARSERSEPEPAPAPMMAPSCSCPRIYKPVCCARGDLKLDEGNSCMCECNGGGVLSEGPCLAVQCACPLIYKPVCCGRGGEKKTEGNECFCGCEGGVVMGMGGC